MALETLSYIAVTTERTNKVSDFCHSEERA
jgi:hypothetical protein